MPDQPAGCVCAGISDGEIVRVFNDRGQILAGAHVTDTIRSDLICVNDVDRSILRTRASPAASTATVT